MADSVRHISIDSAGILHAMDNTGNGWQGVASFTGSAGPPTSTMFPNRPFKAGEIYYDSNGVQYICTAAGSPGTWVPTNGILGHQNTGWQVGAAASATAETLLTSVKIPANTIGLGGVEIITYWSYANSGSNKIARIRFGAANDLTGSVLFTGTTSTTLQQQMWSWFNNRGTGSQIFFSTTAVPFLSPSGAALGTASIDTTADSYLVFSGSCSASADTLKLESYLVRLLPAV